MGVEVNCILPGFSTVEELGRIPEAAANLKLNPDLFTEKMCMYLEDEFGIPSLEQPVRGGLVGVAGWIGCAAEYFGKQKEAEILLASIEKQYRSLMEGPRRLLAGKKCCILTIGNDVSWIREAVELVGMEMQRAYLLKRSDYSSNLTSDYLDKAFTVIAEKDVPDVLREIDSLKPDILLIPASVAVSPEIYQCRLPYVTVTDPFAGRALAEDWIRGTLAPKKEGWREDVA